MWSSNSNKKAIIEETAREFFKGKMPLDSYTWMHSDARLSISQRQQLANWFKQIGDGEMKND